MNWNKKDANTKTETEQETQKAVKEDREPGLLCTHMQFQQEKGEDMAGQDAAAGTWPFVPLLQLWLPAAQAKLPFSFAWGWLSFPVLFRQPSEGLQAYVL